STPRCSAWPARAWPSSARATSSCPTASPATWATPRSSPRAGPAARPLGRREVSPGLGERTWPVVAAAGDAVLAVPLGSTEQHGPHLPLATDTLVAVALVEALALGRTDVVAAPALPYGASGEHAGFPGTLSIGQEALELLLLELARSADHFAGVVFVSGHGGNAAPLARAVATLT